MCGERESERERKRERKRGSHPQPKETGKKPKKDIKLEKDGREVRNDTVNSMLAQNGQWDQFYLLYTMYFNMRLSPMSDNLFVYTASKELQSPFNDSKGKSEKNLNVLSEYLVRKSIQIKLETRFVRPTMNFTNYKCLCT
jgi:hypothetical protein